MRASALICFLAMAPAASAADLGTLFHTAKEREQLERLRKGDTPEAPAIVRPDPVITGYVKRSDGKSTVFIDKQPVPVRNPRLERRLEPKAVERYEPLPMPTADAPPDVIASPASQPATTPAKEAETKPTASKPESKSRETASTAPKAPPPRKRAEKDD